MGDYLQQLEDQLVELTERGVHRRPRPRLDALALVAAVLVVAAVAVTVATIGKNAHRPTPSTHRPPTNTVHHRPHHRGSSQVGTKTVSSTTTPTGPPPLGGPAPAGFGAQSFTAISELNWWMLGDAPCSSPPCTSIVRTTDGGRTFVGIPAPRPQDPSGSDRVSQLRFADPRDGFAYGPGLWVTHDGGAHWQSQSNGRVDNLAIGGGYVYAIEVTNQSTGAGQLLRSPVGDTRFWQNLTAAGNAFGGLWVHGSDVLLESQTGSGQQFEISHDSGATFSRYAAPPSVACQFEEPEPPVVWAHCATGMLSGTWRSGDGGQHFSQLGGLPELPNSAAFGSASATTAVVGFRQLYRTTDAGATWTKVSGPVGITWWQYIGFTDPTHGVALGYVGSEQPSNERLYYTTDGGATYHLVAVP
jgi:photosystem II stability/assembly factor-like uncharacterized protein